MRHDENGRIALSYNAPSGEYRIGRDLVSASQAVDLAERILQHARPDEATEPAQHGAITQDYNQILKYFQPKFSLLEATDQEQFKALIRFKLKYGGAMPSRRELYMFMRPDLDPRREEYPEIKAKKKESVENGSRTFNAAYERMAVHGLVNYRRSNAGRTTGDGKARIVGEAWGVAIREPYAPRVEAEQMAIGD